MVSYFHLIQLHWVGCHPWSTMPPGVRCPPGMRCQSCMWDSQAYVDIFLIKLGSQIPFHIPTKHHTPSCTTNITTEDFHHRSEVSKIDGIRLYARLFKTLEKQGKNNDFPHIPYLQFQSILPKRKNIEKHLQIHFSKKCFLAVCGSFSGIRCL